MVASQRQENPQLLERFGQLMANLSYLAIGPTNEAIWDMEDEQRIAAIRQHIADLPERSADAAG